MNKSKAIAWIGGSLLATTATVVAVAGERGAEREPAYRSSIQVDREIENESELANLARISVEDALRIASASASGKVVEIALENEDGNLVYGVEISGAAGATEVIVDAGDGRILSSAPDSEEHEPGEDEEEEGEREDGK